MDVIEELKYYCNIDNPVGALMISGEWGCGKTYLVKHKLIPKLQGEYAFVCVSLFGLDDVAAIKNEVKRKWIEKAAEFEKKDGKVLTKAVDGFKNIFSTVKEILPQSWQEKGELVSSVVELLNYIPISNYMWERKVVLVFDDLERSNISSIDLLGCINDYCENQHFNTIIIANEEKIKDGQKNKLSYHEIKEKIVQRVIIFSPDYAEVVSNSIETMSCGIEYKGFLKKNKEQLVRILSGDFNDTAIIEHYKAENYSGGTKKREEYQKEEEDLRHLLTQRPHNIRSFKCAIQDFERVYNKLAEAGIKDSSNWLLSFTCLMMTNKAGLLRVFPRYGDFFLYLNVEKLYPEVFKTDFIVSGFSKWIIHGEWNDEIISKQIQIFLEKEKAATPLEILRTHEFPEVDEEIIDKGYEDLIEEVYVGNLTLDEYILFLYNCCYARDYDVILPTINWEKVRDGIKSQIKKIIISGEKNSHSHRMIGEDSRQYFTEEELSAYQIIKEFRDNKVWIYEQNQNLYINLISSDLNSAFRELDNKRYNAFTIDMETATVNAYKNANNMNKRHFSGWFVRIWGHYHTVPEIDESVTMSSLEKLRDDLRSVLNEYKEKRKNIAAKHTQNFIGKLDDIIKMGGDA